MKTFDLNQQNPASIPRQMRLAAWEFETAHEDLASSWQDPQAGKVWAEIARELEKCADKIEQIASRHGFVV